MNSFNLPSTLCSFLYMYLATKSSRQCFLHPPTQTTLLRVIPTMAFYYADSQWLYCPNIINKVTILHIHWHSIWHIIYSEILSGIYYGILSGIISINLFDISFCILSVPVVPTHCTLELEGRKEGGGKGGGVDGCDKVKQPSPCQVGNIGFQWESSCS